MLPHLFYACFLATVLSIDAEVVLIRAVRDRDALINCGQGKVFLDGPDSFVLWLKDDHEFLYRYPAEERRVEKRSMLNRERMFSACEGDSCHDDTSLLLKRVSEHDVGRYHCRIHYQASPSADYYFDLRIVEPLAAPRIYNGAEEEITKGYVGPLSLGSELTLICEVDDLPDTLLFWRRNGVKIEREPTQESGVLRAYVRVLSATRAELDAHYECFAQNGDVSEPLTASVVVKMYRTQMLRRTSRSLAAYNHQAQSRNVSRNLAMARDGTRRLALEIATHQCIVAPLSVEIRLNNNYNFEAGQPRVVDCVVVGCMPPPSVTWQLGDTTLRPNVHKELHDGNYTVSSLTLAPSLRDSKRELICRAHNSLLPTNVFEDKVTLNVGFRPSCVMTREETVGVVHGEAESVTCLVDASPEPMQFSWTFPDSHTLYTSVIKVPGYQHRYSSTLRWVPKEGDVGLLLCRATNTFGEQKRPCTYAISTGGPPLTPDCVVLRSYPNNLRVQCKKAWDGGRRQTMHLEILDEDGTTLHNVSDAAGNFHLPDIQEQRNLTAVVYASSARGRSDTKVLHLQTMKPLTASVTETSVAWARWMKAAAGAVAVAVVIAVSVVCIKLLGRRNQTALNVDLVARSDGSFHREPDFAREERVLGTTNITVNQLASCQNQYSSSPVPACRVMVGCIDHSPPQDACPATLHSYYV